MRRIVEPATLGDPEKPLQYVSKSHAKIARRLQELGHKVSKTIVGALLEGIEFRRQVHRKTYEGDSHPDRDAQFAHIQEQVESFRASGDPAISVDAKKKELIGDFKNAGSDYRAKGCPDHVRVYDFIDKHKGKAVPYGVYDIAQNTAYVSLGVSADTAQFSVNGIRRWWHSVGRAAYGHAKRILITADCGGSNGYRVRLWKLQLQELADEIGLEICVRHYPPGCSKWNRIEHRLFCHISQNWRGTVLASLEVIRNLIAATTTSAGLSVRCELDDGIYIRGVKIKQAQMTALSIQREVFHPEWNYTILPRTN